MSLILVCPADRADALAREHRPSHLVAIASPSDEAFAGHSVDGRRLDLVFHDIAAPQPGLVAPTRRDIDALLAFARDWQGERPLLVQCRMGISRSTAAALVIACARSEPGGEDVLARSLRAVAPCATPNPLIVALADAALGRDGRLVDAVRAIGRGAEYVPQAGFALAIGAATR